MKYPLPPSGYSFNASAKTITFTGTVPAAISNILHVANITRGVVYFQPQGGPDFTGTYAAGVLTLAASTAGHANGDSLLVIYDDGAATQSVSAASLPLPSGAATAAKQPALGTAGTPSADVISIQGISGGTPAPVNCIQVYATASFTRPNDTTAYAAFDVVSDSTTAPTILTFPNVARVNGGSGLIVSARHTKTSGTTTNAVFRLHLYRAAPAAVNDNAVFVMLLANTASRIGYIDFSHISGGAGSTASEGAGVFPAGSVLTYVCGAATTSLFGLLTTLAAYAPSASEVHAIELGVQPN